MRFVCEVCGRTVASPYERFTEAVEYRRLDSKERRHRRQLRDLCRDCVDQIKAEHSGMANQTVFDV